MLAFVTGASSGIGRDMAIYLGNLGYDLILVGRNVEKLEELKKEVDTNIIIKKCDFFNINETKELYKEIESYDINVFINNAGFGKIGYFENIDLEDEINMINVNILSMHILFKLILRNMEKNNKGYILNVSSLASFVPGPLMATYYSTKAYTTRLSESVITELKKKKSNVKVSILCPGPVDTNFNSVAGGKFRSKPLSSKVVAKTAIDKLFKGKKYIIPGIQNKVLNIINKIIPNDILSEFNYRVQKNKIKNK